MDDEDRIALLIDYENLALGSRDHLGVPFDLRPVADALAERGRVVTRRAYADWSYFDEDRRMLTRNHVELIEMTQRMGASRKNAADIKMAVDAIELAYERDYLTTFAICTGDSDFTPLVHKLRELNKRVIGFGVRDSTSTMLPPACDEFLFYDELDGVVPAEEAPAPQRTRTRRGSARTGQPKVARQGRAAEDERAAVPAAEVDGGEVGATDRVRSGVAAVADPVPGLEAERDGEAVEERLELDVLVAQTVAGLQRSSSGPVTASVLKRTLLRKDSTFSETGHGFRAFGELLQHLSDKGIIELSAGPAKGDPEVTLPEGGRPAAFALLSATVADLDEDGDGVALSGLKDQMRLRRDGFSEKPLGYGSFLQFVRGAATQGVVELERVEGGYRVHAPTGAA